MIAALTDSRKIPNTFHHPMVTTLSSGDIVYDPAKEIQFQLQIGSKVFPVYEIKCVPENFSHLKNPLGFIIVIFIMLIFHH